MAPKTGKTRLDVLIVERGLAPSRERAQALLLAGQVRVNGAADGKAGKPRRGGRASGNRRRRIALFAAAAD